MSSRMITGLGCRFNAISNLTNKRAFSLTTIFERGLLEFLKYGRRQTSFLHASSSTCLDYVESGSYLSNIFRERHFHISRRLKFRGEIAHISVIASLLIWADIPTFLKSGRMVSAVYTVALYSISFSELIYDDIH